METSPIYGLRIPDVYRTLETSPEGLSSSEVLARRSLYGENVLSAPVRKSRWLSFFAHTIHPMALLLWLCGGIAFLANRPDLGLMIWIVVLVNAGFSFWRENRAEQAASALLRLLPVYARLVREGGEISLPAIDIVPGDVLVLAEGDHIPADARVVEEYGLRTNNATLTGEAMPARKTADASLREGVSELERPNLVFAGTSVVSGTGRAVVYATGMLTQFGRIARLTQQVREEPSPLQRELARLTRQLGLVAILLGAFLFGIALTELEITLVPALLLGIGTIVAALPEGLPATLTLSLAAASQRLASQGVLVKKLAIIETLGNVSILATDKSGTLTQNQMTVRNIWVAGKRILVTGVGYEPLGRFEPDPSGKPVESDLRALLIAAALCNNSRLVPPSVERPQWSSLGDHTEAALKVTAMKSGLEDGWLNTHYPRIHELPFDARRKRMCTIHAPDGQPGKRGSREIAFVKGAPREVLQFCTHILMDEEIILLDDLMREGILKEIDDYSRSALRVLALARRELEPRTGESANYSGALYSVERVEQGLTFLGLMAMMDPPRPEVSLAVQALFQAGIRMVMITGDYGLTAESLARRVGMLRDRSPIILTGAELDQLSDSELQKYLDQEVIYARMAPENKLRLVSAFQTQGHVVAVTGDGVNDAPALRKADVGISMGIIGTDVSREAADLILTDDNFASITTAIAEGRTIFENLRKFVTYIFSSNVPEIFPFMVAALHNLPFVWSVAQVLAIDLGTDLFPALGLGAEKPEPGVMNRPPRPRNQPLLDRNLYLRAFFWLGPIEVLLCLTGVFALYGLSGNIAMLNMPWIETIPFPQILQVSAAEIGALATTVYFAGVVCAQVGNVFAARTVKAHGRQMGWLSNTYLLGGIGLEIIITLILIYTPFNQLFGFQPLPGIFWFGLSLYPLVIYSLDWIRKEIVRRLA